VALGLAALIVGCAKNERVTMDVGSFRVEAEVPFGWRHLDLGRRHLLQNGENQLAFEDFGPVAPEGIRREVARARELARANRLATAKSVLSMIPIPEELFATKEQRRRFRDDWSLIAEADEHTPPGSLDGAFERVLGNIALLLPRDAASIEHDVLRRMGADDRRDVASRVGVAIDGHRGTLLVTWHRMTHDFRGRHAIFVEAGSALGVWTGRGPLAVTGPPFDRVMRSLRFEAGPADSAMSRTAAK